MFNKSDIRHVALALFALAVAIRLMPHSYNVAAVGALGMFVGYFWSARIGFLMALAAMAVSDLFGHWLQVPSMGFYEPWLMLTVYFAMGLSAFVGNVISRAKAHWGLPLLAGVPCGAVLSTALFFLITNFASWLDPQMGYPRSLAGLVECYAAALPFVKNSLVGNLFYSALFFGGYVALTSPQISPADAK